VTLKGKNGIYDVRVLNQHNEIVAEMRGMSRAIKGQVFQDLERQDNERPHT